METETTSPQRISRRDALRRGALLGGAFVWAAPAVQTIAMRPAFATTETWEDCCEGDGSERIQFALYEYAPLPGSSLSDPAWIVADSVNPNSNNLMPPTLVNAGSTFTVEMSCGGGGTQTNNIMLKIYESAVAANLDGSNETANAEAYAKFHTSCSPGTPDVDSRVNIAQATGQPDPAFEGEPHFIVRGYQCCP